MQKRCLIIYIKKRRSKLLKKKAEDSITRLKMLRLEAGLSLKEMAQSFNKFIVENSLPIKKVSYATLSRWENGINEPKNAVWTALANFFDFPVSLIRGIELSTEEKGIQLLKIIIDLFQPFRIGYETASYLSEEEAENLFQKLHEFYGAPTDIFPWADEDYDSDFTIEKFAENYDVTGALNQYLKTFHLDAYKELTSELRDNEFNRDDENSIIKTDRLIVSKYLQPFVEEMTADNLKYTNKIDYNSVNMFVGWLRSKTLKKELAEHPELIKLRQIIKEREIVFSNHFSDIESIAKENILGNVTANSNRINSDKLKNKRNAIIQDLDDYLQQIYKLVN